MTNDRPAWMDGLSHKDWLFDGYNIRSADVIERWNDLDWSKASVDIGPSPAGNLGPYWHVPLKSGETVHRLYPRLLKSRWGALLFAACQQIEEQVVRNTRDHPDRRQWLSQKYPPSSSVAKGGGG